MSDNNNNESLFCGLSDGINGSQVPSRSKRRKSIDSGTAELLNNPSSASALLSLAALNLLQPNTNTSLNTCNNNNNNNNNNTNSPSSSFSLIQQVQSQLQLSSMAAALLPSVPNSINP